MIMLKMVTIIMFSNANDDYNKQDTRNDNNMNILEKMMI